MEFGILALSSIYWCYGQMLVFKFAQAIAAVTVDPIGIFVVAAHLVIIYFVALIIEKRHRINL